MSDRSPDATLVMAASTRDASINGALARRIVSALDERGERAELVDLTEYEMPMYHGDLEAADGAPAAAHDLVARLADAQRLVIVSPEYNGSFPALLKNTIDWMSRVDRGHLSHLDIHLASATPGRLGGARVLAMMRTWMENMRLHVADRVLSVPRAALGPNGELETPEPVDIDSFLHTTDRRVDGLTG